MDDKTSNHAPSHYPPIMRIVYNRPHGEGRMYTIFNIIHAVDGYFYGNIVVGTKVLCVYCAPNNNDMWYISHE